MLPACRRAPLGIFPEACPRSFAPVADLPEEIAVFDDEASQAFEHGRLGAPLPCCFDA